MARSAQVAASRREGQCGIDQPCREALRLPEGSGHHQDWGRRSAEARQDRRALCPGASKCDLTPRSRRGPTAEHRARLQGRHIILPAGPALCRRPRLTSNVSRHTGSACPLRQYSHQLSLACVGQAAGRLAKVACTPTASGQIRVGHLSHWSAPFRSAYLRLPVRAVRPAAASGRLAARRPAETRVAGALRQTPMTCRAKVIRRLRATEPKARALAPAKVFEYLGTQRLYGLRAHDG